MKLDMTIDGDEEKFEQSGAADVLARGIEHELGLTNNSVSVEVHHGSAVEATTTVNAKQQQLEKLKASYLRGQFNPLQSLNFTMQKLNLHEPNSGEGERILGQSSSTKRTVIFVMGVIFTVMAIWGCTGVAQVYKAPSTRKGGQGLDTSDWMALLAFVGLFCQCWAHYIMALHVWDPTKGLDAWTIVEVVCAATAQIVELFAFTLLVFVFAISVHGVRLTGSGSMLGRLQSYMIGVNILQAIIVGAAWALALWNGTSTQTKAVILLICRITIAAPTAALSLCISAYGFTLVRKIDKSTDKSRQDEGTKAKEAAKHRVTYIASVLAFMYLVRSSILIIAAFKQDEMQSDPAKEKYLILMEFFNDFVTLVADFIILLQYGDKLGWTKNAFTTVMRLLCMPVVYILTTHAHAEKLALPELDPKAAADLSRRSKGYNSDADGLLGAC